MRDDRIEEKYTIATKIPHPRTFHQEVFYTLCTPVRTFYRVRKYAPVDLKYDSATELNARRSNGRKLHDIDNNLTCTHFLRRNYLNA